MAPDDILRVVFGLVAVLGLIGICAITARKAGLLSATTSLTRKRRLAIMESLPLDARRRMLIVKCDETEHLIILGSNGETVVERQLPAREVETTTAQDLGDLHLSRNPFAEIRNALAKTRATPDAESEAA